MIPYDLQGITLRQIEIFFKCAELQNFTKAAAELHVTPGMISKKIADLEAVLNFSLFFRQKNRVALTEEGKSLYAAWRQPVEAMTSRAEDIKEYSKQNRTINFFLWRSTNPERYFVPLMNAILAEEDVLFRIISSEDPCSLDDIASGKLDIAFMPKFMERGVREMESLDSFLALPSPLYAALSENNPLSEKKVLLMEDLQGVNLLSYEGMVPWYTEMVRELCLEHGFSARLKTVEKQVFSTNYLHMDKNAALITDKYFHAFRSNAVEYRELQNTESGLLMIYRKNVPAHVRHLLEFAWNFYKEFR